MKTPKSISHGGVGSLTPADIQHEICDILLSALRRWKNAQINSQISHNELDINPVKSVYASR
jgi:hypothetical protein